MAAANFVPPPPSQPPPPPPLPTPLPAPSLPFPSFFFLFLFSSGALSSCSAVVPPEGFKNNSVNCIPVRRETEKSGWKKTSDSRRSVVVVERGSWAVGWRSQYRRCSGVISPRILSATKVINAGEDTRVELDSFPTPARCLRKNGHR